MSGNKEKSRGRGGCYIFPLMIAGGICFAILSSSSEEESSLQDDSNSSIALDVENLLQNSTEKLLEIIENERQLDEDRHGFLHAALAMGILSICLANFTNFLAYKKLETRIKSFENVLYIGNFAKLQMEAVDEAKEIISKKGKNRSIYSVKPNITENENSIKVNVSVEKEEY